LRTNRIIIAAALILLTVAPALAATKAKAFVPANYPRNAAPVNYPNKPGGTRYEMRVLAKKYAVEDIAIKVKVSGWTEELFKQNNMGTYKVGDRSYFQVVVGDKNSQYFGSVKDGRDGGTFTRTIYWMDETGKKVEKVDTTSVRFACATCGGYYGLYFGVPSFAKTGRHRLNLSYKQKKLGFDLSKDLYFNVVNDGSWNDLRALDEAAKKYPTAAMLQQGRPCQELAIDSYAGVSDTHMIARHRVPDRRGDHCNIGRVPTLRIGHYGPEQRGLIRFELARVPKSSEVAQAHLQIYLGDWPGPEARKFRCSATFTAYDVLKDWNAGIGNGSRYAKPPIRKGEASWQCNSYPTTWAKPGCSEPGVDRAAEPVGKTGVIRKRKQWVTIPLDAAMVTRWVARPETNRGVLLAAKGTAGLFHSSEYEDPAMRPRLILGFKKKIQACDIDGTCTKDGKPVVNPEELLKDLTKDLR
jgi:hypothetical protein